MDSDEEDDLFLSEFIESQMNEAEKAEKRDKFYNDEYIYSFFTYQLPKFDNYTILEILKDMPIETFLLLQSTTNDKFIKQLKLKDINPKPLEYSTFWHNDFSGACIREIDNCQNTIINCMNYNKTLGHYIPINFSIHQDGQQQICLPEFLEDLLDNNNYFELELQIRGFNFTPLLKSLETFRFGHRVTQIVFCPYKTQRESDVTKLDIDFSNYIKLNMFYAWMKQTLTINLPPSSIQSLTSLTLANIYDPNCLIKLDNLKTLQMMIKEEVEFDIKYLPRNLKELSLLCNNGIININSENDWPQNLEQLKLQDVHFLGFPFEKFQHYKLPPNLKKLSADVHVYLDMFTQLPDLLSNLEISLGPRAFATENILKVPLGLKDLQISNWYSISSSDTIEFESALEKLILTNISFPLPQLNFQTLKHSLRDLDISKYQHEISLYHMNFSQFTSLETIIISSSTFESLENFKPSPSITYIEIHKCHIRSITDECLLFNSPLDFPKLTEISFIECDISYISPNIKLPINLKSFKIHDNTVKGFSLTNSMIYHPTLEYLTVGVIKLSKLIPDDLKPLDVYFKSKLKTFSIEYISCSQMNLDQFCHALEQVFRRKILRKHQFDYKLYSKVDLVFVHQ
ncbi:hypothetical protein DFJ63DRAFT_336520 [Scheffersomyces coipomensis]|uniref:uncharacterized protein n=1 Tax=Scheffersomyces coipomensis TaxID=1788519 RepID=UPI00315C604C